METKEQMIKKIQKSLPTKSVKFLNSWTKKEVEKYYYDGIDCGMIKRK